MKLSEPAGTWNKTFREWQRQTLDDCILSGDRGCNLQDGDIVDHEIVRK